MLDGGGPAPRIPPLRLLAGSGITGPVWDARAEIEHVTRQTKIASFETETAAYTLVNASVSFRPFADRPNTAIVVSANNIFDVDARRHASFLKDFAPLARSRYPRFAAFYHLTPHKAGGGEKSPFAGLETCWRNPKSGRQAGAFPPSLRRCNGKRTCPFVISLTLAAPPPLAERRFFIRRPGDRQALRGPVPALPPAAVAPALSSRSQPAQNRHGQPA